MQSDFLRIFKYEAIDAINEDMAYPTKIMDYLVNSTDLEITDSVNMGGTIIEGKTPAEIYEAVLDTQDLYGVLFELAVDQVIAYPNPTQLGQKIVSTSQKISQVAGMATNTALGNNTTSASQFATMLANDIRDATFNTAENDIAMELDDEFAQKITGKEELVNSFLDMMVLVHAIGYMGLSNFMTNEEYQDSFGVYERIMLPNGILYNSLVKSSLSSSQSSIFTNSINTSITSATNNTVQDETRKTEIITVSQKLADTPIPEEAPRRTEVIIQDIINILEKKGIPVCPRMIQQIASSLSK